MSVILEEDALTEWLVSYLGADTTLMAMLNGDIAPQVYQGSSASPFVRADRLDGVDLMSVGVHRVWVDCRYHVRGVFHWRGSGRPDRTEVNAIGARLDALLHGKEAVTATHHIHGFREDPEPTPAVLEPNGELWLQAGGIYRLRVYAL